MKAYFGFDDTDTDDSPFGTGKLARWFQEALPDGCEPLGVVRQQLFVCDEIPYTSHNSAACLIAEIPDPDFLNDLIERAANHLEAHAAEGSDPGLCVATEFDSAVASLVDFGGYCTRGVSTQRQAVEAAKNLHLSGHGGTNDGIIGAAAAVGLTASGWAGRFIEFGNLRGLPESVSVSDLRRMGIHVVSVERDAKVPAPNDTVLTNGWLRPRLMGNLPVLMASPRKEGEWQNIHWKRKKNKS
jgi:hypothetical protein